MARRACRARVMRNKRMTSMVKVAADTGCSYLQPIPNRHYMWPQWKREHETRVYDWEMTPSLIASFRDQTIWERYS